MKKLFTLLTLALLSMSSVWADSAGSVTISWPMNDGAATPSAIVSGTSSVSDLFSINDASCTSKLVWQDIAENLTFSDEKSFVGAQFKPTENLTNNKTSVSSECFTFSFTLNEGVTFTPTGYAFKTARQGTGEGTAKGEFTLADETKNSTAVFQPGRANSTASTFQDVTIESATAFTNGATITLKVYFGGKISGKKMNIGDVTITGTYTKADITTYDLTTSVNPAESGTITRSPNQTAYSVGKSVTLTATPNYGYTFTNWTKDDVVVSTNASFNITTAAVEETYVANFAALPTYALTLTASPSAGGTVSKSPAHDAYIEGEEVTLTATPKTGYAFTRWTKDDVEVSTNKSFTITTTNSDVEYVAEFQKQIAVTYNISDGDKGTTPNALGTEYYDNGTEFTVPFNYYINKDGYTMTAWTDGTNNYTPGEGVITLTEDIELQPVFTANTEALTKNIASQTVKWSFDNTGSAPAINCEGFTGYYVKRVDVNGSNIDVALYLNEVAGCVESETKGKVFNVGRSNAQVRVNSLITIPAIKDMTVVIELASGTITNTTVNGKKFNTVDGNKYTFNYDGANGTTDVIIKDKDTYWKSLSITFPKTHTYVDVTNAGYRTFASSSALDFTESITGLKAYKATATGSTIKFEDIECAVPAETGMLLKADEGRYYIPLASGDPAELSDNKLVGTTTKKENVEAGIYVLMNGAQGVGFYKTTAAFTVGANTAYLPADVAAGRTFIGFDEESETTGIEAIERSQMKDNFFNLNGQRVAAPQKGIYIMNGKKVIKK